MEYLQLIYRLCHLDYNFVFVHCLCRFDFRCSLMSGLPHPPPPPRRSAGSFPEQRLVIEAIVYVSIMKIMGDYFSAEGYIMLDKFFSVVITLLHSFISIFFLINHHHASFTYREIGCCVFTRKSSRFLAHVSAASQPLNLNPPCLPSPR